MRKKTDSCVNCDNSFRRTERQNKCDACKAVLCATCRQKRAAPSGHSIHHSIKVVRPRIPPTKGEIRIDDMRFFDRVYRYKASNWPGLHNDMRLSCREEEVSDYFMKKFVRSYIGQFCFEASYWASYKYKYLHDGRAKHLLTRNCDSPLKYLLLLDVIKNISPQEEIDASSPNFEDSLLQVAANYIENLSNSQNPQSENRCPIDNGWESSNQVDQDELSTSKCSIISEVGSVTRVSDEDQEKDERKSPTYDHSNRLVLDCEFAGHRRVVETVEIESEETGSESTGYPRIATSDDVYPSDKNSCSSPKPVDGGSNLPVMPPRKIYSFMENLTSVELVDKQIDEIVTPSIILNLRNANPRLSIAPFNDPTSETVEIESEETGSESTGYPRIATSDDVYPSDKNSCSSPKPVDGGSNLPVMPPRKIYSFMENLTSVELIDKQIDEIVTPSIILNLRNANPRLYIAPFNDPPSVPANEAVFVSYWTKRNQLLEEFVPEAEKSISGTLFVPSVQGERSRILKRKVNFRRFEYFDRQMCERKARKKAMLNCSYIQEFVRFIKNKTLEECDLATLPTRTTNEELENCLRTVIHRTTVQDISQGMSDALNLRREIVKLQRKLKKVTSRRSKFISIIRKR